MRGGREGRRGEGGEKKKKYGSLSTAGSECGAPCCRDLWGSRKPGVDRSAPTKFWGMSRAKMTFFRRQVKKVLEEDLIHGPLGYEPNTLTTAPLRSWVRGFLENKGKLQGQSSFKRKLLGK